MLLTLALLSMLAAATGCNEFLYNSSAGAFSGRLLDLGPNLNPSVSYIPRGANLQGFRVSKGGETVKYTSKYGFAFAASKQGEIQLLAPALGFTVPALGVATDGINEKGLSAAFLYDSLSEPPAYPNYTGNGPAISTFDFVAYALALYANVAEVRAAFAAGLLLVDAYDPIPVDSPSPYHISVRDADRNMLVIEYNPDGVLSLYDANEYLVLTNNPEYSTHIEQVTSFLAPGVNGATPTYLTAPQGAPEYANVTFADNNQIAYTYVPLTPANSTWWPFPGDYSSVSRFIRLYMLNKQIQQSITYPQDVTAEWSPAAYPGGFDFKALFMATEGQLNAVALPIGIDDKGGYNPPTLKSADFWQLEVIRDHINPKFWWKIPSSPQWKLIDVTKAAAQDPQPDFNGDFFGSATGAELPWYLDLTELALKPKGVDIASQIGNLVADALSKVTG